jgi:lipoprotein-anchoring transpeptidase ErfK/SrfK
MKKSRSKTPFLSPVLWIGTFLVVTLIPAKIYLLQHQIPCANSGSCTGDLSEKIENGAVAVFRGQTMPAPQISLTDGADIHNVLGESNSTAEKHIYVDLSAQKLFAYEGDKKIFETLVATGRWGKTPTGNFHIWEKLRSTRMAGGSGSDAYNLPNVPFVMYFYHDFGLHGAYWHDNFGHTMSHGCVNLRQIDAEFLFNWADGPSDGNPGTAVSICDTFTQTNICTQQSPVQ